MLCLSAFAVTEECVNGMEGLLENIELNIILRIRTFLILDFVVECF